MRIYFIFFRLRVEKMFFVEILWILAKFHEKTLSRPGDIKTFYPGRRMQIYTLLPFTDAVLSEKRQLMKWVGIFQVGIFREDFPVGSLMGGNFPGGNFPRTLLHRPISKLTHSLMWALDKCCWNYFHKCYKTLNITI